MNAILSCIVMMIALYSIKLRIMWRPQISLNQETILNKQFVTIWEKTGIDGLLNNIVASFSIDRFPSSWGIALAMIIVIIVIKLLIDFYLKKEVGLALRANGNNKQMFRILSANNDSLIYIFIINFTVIISFL